MPVRDLQELADGFSLFDNWEDRYRYLIDLGQRLRPMDESLKTDDRLVKGCTSRVWMTTGFGIGDEGRRVFKFEADSDAQIIKGLIYILAIAYQNKPLDEIAELDIHKGFEQLGLAGHLSPNRRNGFFAMVEHIKRLSGAS